jgi:hypothetical protein
MKTIILADSEIEIIFEALLTEKRESIRERDNAVRKGRGGYEKRYLARVDEMLSRFRKWRK